MAEGWHIRAQTPLQLSGVLLWAAVKDRWQRRSWAKRFPGWMVIGIFFIPIAAAGCAGSTCNDPSASSTPELKPGELRSDVLCRGSTVRVSVAVEGNHFYTMLGDLSVSLLGNNKIIGRMYGPPISEDIKFTFTGFDQLTENIVQSFFARSSGIVTVEVTNGSDGFVQGGQSIVNLLGDSSVIGTSFRIVDSGLEDHGERPEDATQLPSDNSVTAGTLRRGDEMDYFRLSVEAGKTYRVVFEATSDLRLGTARVDRFGQFTPFVPTDGGNEFTARVRRGIVESREFSARTTEDLLLAVANPPADPVELLSLFGLSGTPDSFPIEYAITVGALGPGTLKIECRNTEPAPPIDWAQIEARAAAVFDVTCQENTLDDVFLKYVQRDPDVIVETMSSGSRFMVLHDTISGIQEVFIPGTNTADPNDLLTDIAANPVFDEKLKASFHGGALERARQSRSEIERLLDSERPTRVTGYSLGGAVAAIFGLYLELDGFQVDSVLTFGQFPVTDEAGVRLFADRPLLRIKSGRDGAPDLYTQTYDHFGDMIILLDGPLFVYLGPNNENFASATSDLRAFDPFVDHTTYLDRLRGKLPAPAKVSFCDAAGFITDGVDDVCP